MPAIPARSLPLALILCGLVALAAARSFAEEIPADPPPRWWKGNIHTHSLWSDGNDFPEMISEWYRTRDYQFLAISDHNVLAEGERWMKHSEVLRRAGEEGWQKYLARFGRDWVETRGDAADGTLEVRLKPFDEYRALLEERGAFLLIPSEEISDSVGGAPVHLNATNIADVVQPLGGTTVREAIENNIRAVEDQARRRGREIIVHLNHPNFHYAITAEDLAHAVSERFFEVYNGHPGVNHQGDEEHPGVERLWDIANVIRLGQLEAAPLWAVATDDTHDYHHHGEGQSARPGRGWIMIRARHLTPESLIRAMRRGDFYASSGVVLNDVRYDAEGAILEVEIQPDGDAVYTTQFIGTLAGEAADSTRPQDEEAGDAPAADVPEIGQVLAEVEGTSASYRLTGKELYVRAVVTSSLPHVDPSFDGQLRQAWTQPVGWERRVSP